VLLRFLKPDPIPAEAVHGRRTGSTVTMRLRVGGVLPDRGFGRFGLLLSQQLPRNAYLPLGALQGGLGQEGKVNSLFVAARESTGIRAAGCPTFNPGSCGRHRLMTWAFG
jgi:hypothetical protein